jgi:gamma-glutamyl phosphate reductase
MKSDKRTLTVQGEKKLHARGPTGLERLARGTGVVFGQGKIRE